MSSTSIQQFATTDPPQLRAVADTGVLVEFGQVIDDAVHQRVLQLDDAIQTLNPAGITELVPAFATLLVGYDPLLTDFKSVCEHINKGLEMKSVEQAPPGHWQVPVCYEGEFARDLTELAKLLSIDEQQIIDSHISTHYKVYMYGFTPGVAYLGGVPELIQIPRKNAPVMNIPAGSVMIAGKMSLITTIKMPTGWWIIGRAARTPLQPDAEQPFAFAVGDTVEFVPVNEADFAHHAAQPTWS